MAFCMVLNTPVLLVFFAVFLLFVAVLVAEGFVAATGAVFTLVLSTYSECICGAELTNS